MGMEFGLYINIKKVKERDAVKEFTKDYYSQLDFISDNIESCSGSKSVCIDCLGVDSDEIEFVSDSILKGDYIKAITLNGYKIESLAMRLEYVGVSVADFNGNKVNYRAADFEGYSAVKVSGTIGKSLSVEDIEWSDDLLEEIDNRVGSLMDDCF